MLKASSTQLADVYKCMSYCALRVLHHAGHHSIRPLVIAMVKRRRHQEDDLSDLEPTPLVCVTTVRNSYKLKDEDFAHLKYKKLPNPHYLSAAPMRLYNEEEIKKIADAKNKQRAYELEHADEIKAAKDAEKKAIAKAYLDDCTAKVDSWQDGAIKSLPYRTGTALHLDIWEKILKKLCEDLDTKGLRGPSVIARDLINASLTCKELFAAALPAMQHLGQMCPSLPSTVSEDLCNEFVLNPDSLLLSEIKTLAKSRGVRTSQQKPIIIVELIQRMGLKRPIRVPIRLVQAVVKEKQSYTEELTMTASKMEAFRGIGYMNSFNVRLKCQQMGFTTNLQIQEAANAEQKARQDRQKEERAAAKAQRANANAKAKAESANRRAEIMAEKQARDQARKQKLEAEAQKRADAAQLAQQNASTVNLPTSQSIQNSFVLPSQNITRLHGQTARTVHPPTTQAIQSSQFIASTQPSQNMTGLHGLAQLAQSIVEAQQTPAAQRSAIQIQMLQNFHVAQLQYAVRAAGPQIQTAIKQEPAQCQASVKREPLQNTALPSLQSPTPIKREAEPIPPIAPLKPATASPRVKEEERFPDLRLVKQEPR